MNRSNFLKGLTVLALAFSAGIAGAQAWPGKPVRLVVGAPSGTAPDVAARLVADRLTAAWGQPVVIDNKPGAGGMIAMEFVRNSTDGHTLMFANAGAVLVTPKILKAAKYDPINDFTTLGMVADSPMIIVANNDAPGRNLADMINAAKGKPAAMALGSTEQATVPYLVGHRLSEATGATFQHVPFNQPAQAIQSLVKGDLHYYVDGIAPVLGLVRANRIKAVALLSDRKLPGLEDIPLAKDVVPGFVAVGWFALLGPKGMPSDLAGRINRDLNAALVHSELVTKMRDLSLFPTPKSPAESTAFLRYDVERWGAVIKKVGLEPQ